MTPSSSLPSLRTADIDASSAPAMRALFQQVFGKPMSEDFWRWKYAQGHGIGVWMGDELVAHYGGVGADIVWQGKPARAVQIVDVMVLPTARNAVRSQSPFFVASSEFLQRYIGHERPYLLGFGFPSQRAFDLAAHLKLYAAVGEVCELRVQARAASWRDWRYQWQAVTLQNLPQHSTAIAALALRMQQSLPQAILLRKDAARLQQRYLQHPEHHYQLYLLTERVTGRLQALAVFKQEANRVLLMDLICERSALTEVLQRCALFAQQQWQLPLAAWLSTAYAKPLVSASIRLHSLGIVIPANIWNPGPDPATLQDRWWLMAGDTDFL